MFCFSYTRPEHAKLTYSCADPESLARGGPTFFYKGKDDPNSANSVPPSVRQRNAIIGPPAKRHLNGVSLAGRWWPNIECWLGSFVIYLLKTLFYRRNLLYQVCTCDWVLLCWTRIFFADQFSLLKGISIENPVLRLRLKNPSISINSLCYR